MKHRFVRRVSALALAGCLLAGSSLPAFAAASAAKEEVIYANLTASGAVTGVYAVNSFSVQAGDTVADHGSYTAVRNMTTSDAVEQSGDTVTVHVTEDGKLYYEGTMDAATALPWVVKLTYTLDGAEISPDELGGKSGALSIRLQVSRNPDCTGSFFDDYALQVTMSLDTGLARNISAPGATVANVGSKKQLSYILLPGADSDVTVTADVTDFAMDAVSLNGVRLNLNLDLGDMDLTGMLEQLQSGSVQLDDGANALADGIAQVQAGIDTLNGNSGALTGGSARVRAALTQMQTALNGISASTDELNTLLDASTQIRDGIARLDEGAAQLEQQVSFEAYKAILKENGLDLDVVKEGNAKAIEQLQGMVWMMPQLKDVILLLQGSTANIDAMQTYLDTVNGGIAQLHEGSSTLNGSYGEFDAGVRQLAGVLTGMLGNLSVLTDGVNQLVQLGFGLVVSGHVLVLHDAGIHLAQLGVQPLELLAVFFLFGIFVVDGDALQVEFADEALQRLVLVGRSLRHLGTDIPLVLLQRVSQILGHIQNGIHMCFLLHFKNYWAANRPMRIQLFASVISTSAYSPRGMPASGRRTTILSASRASIYPFSRLSISARRLCPTIPASRSAASFSWVSVSSLNQADFSSAGMGSGIRAAGVPFRGEKMKVKRETNFTCRTRDRVSSKSSRVSPGKPTMTSLVKAMSGTARRA